jgi:hypothetical protein
LIYRLSFVTTSAVFHHHLLLGIFAKVIVAITTKVGFVFHAHKASELPLFVVRCLTDVNTKGNCFVTKAVLRQY